MNTKVKYNKNFLNEAIKFSNDNSFKEICGFIYFNDGFKFKEATNFSKVPDLFEIHPAEFLEFKNKNNLVAIYHSHINSDEKMSEQDMESSKNCLYPYVAYSIKTKKFSYYYESDYEPPIQLIKNLEEVLNDY